MPTMKQLKDTANCSYIRCNECACNFAETALALAKMLRQLEWSNRIPLMNYLPVYEHRCPLCGWHEFNGHAPNCELGNMLKELDIL